MTGAEHYREAERWLTHAHSTYMDDSNDPGPREDYASEAEYLAAVADSNEAHEQSCREATTLAALGQVHATLAVAAFQREQSAMNTLLRAPAEPRP